MSISKNTCDDIKSKYVTIGTEYEILKYLNLKLNCIQGSKVLDRIKKDFSIIKISDAYVNITSDNNIYRTLSKYAPAIIDNKLVSELLSTDNYMLDNRIFKYKQTIETNCQLCNIFNLENYTDSNSKYDKDIYRFLLGNYYPDLDEFFLLYKNYVIAFNNDPYMKDHMMLLSTNHVNKEFKGSQYEILNREVLNDIVTMHLQI